MNELLMILPSHDPEKIRVVRVPEDYEDHEAYRHVTGLIARIEEADPGCDLEDILEVLADHGFTPIPFVMGPEID